MTEPGIYYPENLKPEELDLLLSKGWYRMGQGIFTTNYLQKSDLAYRVFWLRYHLKKVHFGRSQQKIKSANKNFTSTIKTMELTEELEALYAKYKSAVSFEAATSVQYWLFMEQTKNVYNTSIIEIRDGNKLIAAGIFDIGNNSMAGIMNFYDPEYKKYSPGKYLILLKIEQAITSGMQWYYPGYIVAGYPKFDYKLFADKDAAELFIPELNAWVKYHPAIPELIINLNKEEASL